MQIVAVFQDQLDRSLRHHERTTLLLALLRSDYEGLIRKATRRMPLRHEEGRNTCDTAGFADEWCGALPQRTDRCR